MIFDIECDLIVEAIPEYFSTYDKYRYLAAILSMRADYDYDFTGGLPTATAYGAIEGHLAICQGYSRAFEYLCKKADLWCKIVSGASDGSGHVWNLVKLESGTYHIDVTWSDSTDNETLDEGWHRYFMITQEQVLLDHEISDGTVATGTPFQ
ncbi:MAG: transglutaminase domain-containing protein [Ruminiclostridium sp.]